MICECKKNVDTTTMRFDSSYFTRGLLYIFFSGDGDDVMAIDDNGDNHFWTEGGKLFNEYFKIIDDTIEDMEV